ncbi:MAG: 3-hydroxyisobutyrate dehydrogenase [Pseudomonadales bacterium]
MTTIGFVGLGNMGGPMARNLIAAGHEVRVFDLMPEAVQQTVAAGADKGNASAADSAAAAAAGVDVLVSMLPASRHVEGLYLGADGLAASLSSSTLVIDCSTIDAATSQRVSAALAERGIAMLDAPVSGGTAGAENGTLTFIVGGEAEALARARPLLEIMGGNIYHAGASGAGQTAKICNNMLLAVLMAGTAEALALGVNNGLDPGVLSEIMKQSSGGNWALNVYNPYPGVMPGVPADRGYEGGFLVDLMAKDLGLAMQTAEQSDSTVPMGALARQLYSLHRGENGSGRLDFSSIQMLFKPSLKE